MQSEKEEVIIEAEAYGTEESHLRSFELYEEYSQRNIADTIRTRMESFDRADIKAKRELAAKVEDEVESFRAWLEETKDLQKDSAHYYSASLKSLLLGLPAGVLIAHLFDKILNSYNL